MVHHHLPHVVARAEFSVCKLFRYRLTLTDSRKYRGSTVCVIMQNPSVADEHRADKSVQFLEKLIFEKGLPEFKQVRRCIIVNQFARIQTRDFRGEHSDLGRDNDLHIRKAVEESGIVLIAWGKRNRFTERQQVILELLDKYEGKKVLLTKKHPSRGSYSDFILPYVN